MDNKKLWKEAFTTDPRAVKKITGKSYQGNSPKPYFLIERATDIFGPIGIGWGCIVKSERFERLSETDVLHVAVVSVWYVYEGKRSETFDQMGGTKACYMTKESRLVVDEDAGKKSVTDAMVKCLSMIGFAGDIFSGMWDDSKYVEWASDEYRRRENPMQALADEIIRKFDAGNEWGAFEEYVTITDNDDKLALWSILKPRSEIRSSLKRLGEEQRKKEAELQKMADGSDPALIEKLQQSIEQTKKVAT